MKKREAWIKPRHKVVTALIRPIVALIAALRYHVKIDRFTEQGSRNWLILSNHQTDFDQFFVSLAFKNPVYYVALEDLFSNGFISRVISWLVAPIPFMKASADARSVMTCFRVAREGGNIAIFPEGNRTYSGRTCYINPSIASLAKKLGLPIAIFRIEGGYGVKPRWAVKGRRGRMRAYVRRVIEPEEYKSLSKEELYELLCRELWVDEAADTGLYPCRTSAEALERVLYICPDCGPSEFASHGDILRCKHCGRQYRYLANKQLKAVDGETPFRYVADWYDYQESYVRVMDLSPYVAMPLYRETADLSEVIVYDRKHLLKSQAPIGLFADRLEIGSGQDMTVLAYDDIKAMACIGGHKLNIFYKDRIYQLKGDRSFNALKYCHIYYHAKYNKDGHTDGTFQFLGL